MIQRPPRGATERERHTDIVSRTVAILVMAAGGEIKVPRALMQQADFIELEQVDWPGGVTWRAKPHRRAAAGTIIEGEGRVIDQPAALPTPHMGEE